MDGRLARGAIAVELVAAVGLLLLPVVLLVTSLPVWSQRQYGATVAAREAARVVAGDYPADGRDRAVLLGKAVAANYGLDPAETSVRIDVQLTRGGEVRAAVTVVMPALQIPGIGSAGSWHWTAVQVRRIDDYRSR